MRDVDERHAWSNLLAANANVEAVPFSFGKGTIDIARPCIALGGRNGAGKTRALKAIASALGERGAFINMHHLIEHAHILYRSREDLDEMADESGVSAPTSRQVEDLQKIVGRTYDSIEWSALDLGPSEESVAEVFKWRGDQPVVPYFRVSYRGITYASPDMGLGEFSVHFLLWILEQYEDQEDLTLLLDEPDAFLPPRGVRSLLACIQDICLRRKWKLMLSTHSEEVIDAAIEHGSFLLLRVDDYGVTEVLDTAIAPEVVSEVLTRSSLKQFLFVEDEVAACVLTAAINEVEPRRLSQVEIIWGNGHGYMRELIKNLPRPPKPRVKFGFVFDGDQRNEPVKSGSGSQFAFLPTADEPDELLRSARTEMLANASMFGTTEAQMAVFFDSLEGENSHDWVIKVGDKYERRRVLPALAGFWAAAHSDDCEVLLSAIS